MHVAFRYMIEFVLSDPDILGIRFAVSPLNEVALSLRALNDPGRHPLHLPWIRAVLARRDRLDLPVLTALVNARGWLPDFLSPRPASPLTRIGEELERLIRTPPATVRADLEAVHGTLPRAVSGDPARVLERVLTALDGYWTVAFAPHWERMRALLDADIAHRARIGAESGIGAVLTGLSERVSFTSPVVGVRIRGASPRRTRVAGAGLTLLPSLFALHTAVPVDEGAPPMLIYAARGVATLWERPRPTGALAGLIGRARAELLDTLTEPASSTELARRTGVTASAVNQHLRALRDAGLLTSRRDGRSVRYLRTELGDALVAGRSPLR